MAIDGIPQLALNIGECDAHLCENEVQDDEGKTVFATAEALLTAARAHGWYVEERDDAPRLYCFNHTRHRYGRAVGPLAAKNGRDLGHRWDNA